MSTSKSSSKSNSDGDGRVETSTSGPNAQASAKSRDEKGEEWISKSTSKLDENGSPITKKIFGRRDNEDNESGSSWTLLGSKSSRSRTVGDDDSMHGSDVAADVDASTGRDVHTKAGKASAGVKNGVAWSKAG
ncbi:hypothetical protein AC578_942 [Pseudocercospora eumusae]|uniref:Uncharacterized protein n=1 Tax=Pseudocercospora eumusae TaxID=321146 RepID=A0A139GV77_9PEZI|nr:hypothetical protein AC578_942 [Pseudocercospora eumusae]